MNEHTGAVVRKSSAEITKGASEVLTLSETDVTECIDLRDLLNILAEGFVEIDGVVI